MIIHTELVMCVCNTWAELSVIEINYHLGGHHAEITCPHCGRTAICNDWLAASISRVKAYWIKKHFPPIEKFVLPWAQMKKEEPCMTDPIQWDGHFIPLNRFLTAFEGVWEVLPEVDDPLDLVKMLIKERAANREFLNAAKKLIIPNNKPKLPLAQARREQL
jgi:hypothetical protein